MSTKKKGKKSKTPSASSGADLVLPPGLAGMFPTGDAPGIVSTSGMSSAQDIDMLMRDSNDFRDILRPMKDQQISRAPAGDVRETSRWITVYPQYIDSTKTIAEGRRITKGLACDKPIVQEISEVLQYLKLFHSVEPKCYSRDWSHPGRVKVKLFDESNEPVHADIRTRKSLLRKLAELIPNLKSREERLSKSQSQKTKVSSSPMPSAQSLSASSANNKKKGRKKR